MLSYPEVNPANVTDSLTKSTARYLNDLLNINNKHEWLKLCVLWTFPKLKFRRIQMRIFLI